MLNEMAFWGKSEEIHPFNMGIEWKGILRGIIIEGTYCGTFSIYVFIAVTLLRTERPFLLLQAFTHLLRNHSYSTCSHGKCSKITLWRPYSLYSKMLIYEYLMRTSWGAPTDKDYLYLVSIALPFGSNLWSKFQDFSCPRSWSKINNLT